MISEKIVIIGSGRIASTLVPELLNAGFNDLLVFGRNKLAVKELNEKYCLPDTSEFEFPKTALYIFAVPDSAIKNLTSLLLEEALFFDECTFLHLSGALNITELITLAEKGSKTGSFHILQTFPTKVHVPIAGCFAGIEASDEELLDYLFALAKSIKLKPVELHGDSKLFYHLSAVFVSNFSPALIAAAKSCFEYANITGHSFAEIFTPIITRAIDNSLANEPADSISGPVIRGDVNTIAQHILSLELKGDFISLLLYLASSLKLVELIETEKKPLKEDFYKVKEMLLKKLSEISERLNKSIDNHFTL